jgi:hypothetical protein
MDNQNSNLLNEQQRKDLVDEIYDWIMSNDEMGLGDMGDAVDEAERIVRKWEKRTEKPDLDARYSQLAEDSTQELKQLVSEGVVLWSHDTDEDDDMNTIYDLPITYWVGKYGDYEEYAIIRVEKGLKFIGRSVSNGVDDEMTFGLGDLNLSVIIDIITEIKSK